MKNTKGIACKVNNYHVTAIAVVEGEPKQLVFDTPERNAREAKKFAANEFGVKASQVLVNFELQKREFVIDSTYDALTVALASAGIQWHTKEAE